MSTAIREWTVSAELALHTKNKHTTKATMAFKVEGNGIAEALKNATECLATTSDWWDIWSIEEYFPDEEEAETGPNAFTAD